MTLVLVDGSNVARSAGWAAFVDEESRELGLPSGGDVHDAQGRLLDWILSWSSRLGHAVHVVFDGEGRLGAGEVEWGPRYLVTGSGAEEGDAVVERIAAGHRRARTPYWLVTDDRDLRAVAGAHAAQVIGVDSFIAQITAVPEPGANSGSVVVKLSEGTRLVESLDPDVRARLERMRRGES